MTAENRYLHTANGAEPAAIALANPGASKGAQQAGVSALLQRPGR
jgi:hypothetical protein